MSNEITIRIPAEYDLGPAMRKLNERQRKFVEALYATGGRSYTEAAMIAGYSTDNKGSAAVTGHRLAHDAKIRDAIHEVARERMTAGGAFAVQQVIQIAETPGHKDQLKAAFGLMDRIGFHAKTEHAVTVVHEDRHTVAKEIAEYAKQLGIDPKTLLGDGIIDVDYAEVQDRAGGGHGQASPGPGDGTSGRSGNGSDRVVHGDVPGPGDPPSGGSPEYPAGPPTYSGAPSALGLEDLLK